MADRLVTVHGPARPCPEATFNIGSIERCARSLRTLLSLSWQTQAILARSKPEPLPAGANSPASADEKVALIRSLFRGREDVYALRWENARTGENGYVPAVVGGWSERGGPKTYLP